MKLDKTLTCKLNLFCNRHFPQVLCIFCFDPSRIRLESSVSNEIIAQIVEMLFYKFVNERFSHLPQDNGHKSVMIVEFVKHCPSAMRLSQFVIRFRQRPSSIKLINNNKFRVKILEVSKHAFLCSNLPGPHSLQDNGQNSFM